MLAYTPETLTPTLLQADRLEITGPPGTGKTRYIAQQVANAVRDYGPTRVVVTSYTQAAAYTAAGRIGRLIPPTHIATVHKLAKNALEALDGVPLKIADGTEGLKLWNDYARESGLTWAMLSVAANNEQRLEFAPNSDGVEGSGNETFSLYTISRTRKTPIKHWPQRVRAFGQAWERWKTLEGRVDFCDLLIEARERLPYCPLLVGKPGKWEIRHYGPMAFFVDEAQDGGGLWFDLVDQWGRACVDADNNIKGRFILVFDRDQCLFRWAGAMPELCNAPDGKRGVLRDSQRCPRLVQEYACNWISQDRSKKHIDWNGRGLPNPEDPEDNRCQHALDNDWTLDGQIVNLHITCRDGEDLAAYIHDELVAGHTVGVQASCSHFLLPLLSVLKTKGVPFHNPNQTNRGDWNPFSRKAADRVLAFMRGSWAWSEDMRPPTWADVWQWAEKIRADGNLLRGAKKALEALATDMGTIEVDIPTVEQYFTPEAFNAAFLENDCEWLSRNLLDAGNGMRYPLAILNNPSYGPEWIKPNEHGKTPMPRLKVGTYHSFKGDQFYTAICFPDLSKAGLNEYLSIDPQARAAVYRLLYVGVSRSLEKLVLCDALSVAAVKWL